MQRAVLLLSKAFQFKMINPRNAPSAAIRDVEAPTERDESISDEKSIPPIPPRTQIYIIFSYLTIDSNIVPNIRAKILLENM